MRITLAQLNYTIGDFEGNYQLIQAAITAHASQCDLIVFSELCLSGYYPRDLIEHAGFIETQNLYLKKICALTAELKTAVVVGFVSASKKQEKKYHNSLCLIANGKIEYTYHKRLLPVYNIFDEARHFSPGKQKGFFRFKDCNIGFLICEDGWVGLNEYRYECDPVDDLVNSSCDLIICINGSPSNVGKQEDRLSLFSTIANRCHCPLLFVNQVGGNDDIVFDGASFVLDKVGKLTGKLQNFEPDLGVVQITDKEIRCEFKITHPPSDLELFYAQTLLGLQDYLRKTNFKQVVLGLSGGIDSALTLALCVIALGKDKVVTLAMPSPFSSEDSLADARLLSEIFDVPLYVFSIEEEFKLACQNFEKVFKQKPSAITSQNIQARIRGRILMEYSNQYGALVLSTGNKSELSVGYTTLYGDMTGGYNLIGDLYKTDVYKLARYINERHPNTQIPVSVMEKEPSAELAPNQKDSDTLPPYEKLDPLLKLYIEGDLLPEHELRVYQQFAKSNGELFNKVTSMVDHAEFKRRQAAPIVRVQRRAFGHGRQLPIAARYDFLRKDS